MTLSCYLKWGILTIYRPTLFSFAKCLLTRGNSHRCAMPESGRNSILKWAVIWWPCDIGQWDTHWPTIVHFDLWPRAGLGCKCFFCIYVYRKWRTSMGNWFHFSLQNKQVNIVNEGCFDTVKDVMRQLSNVIWLL